MDKYITDELRNISQRGGNSSKSIIFLICFIFLLLFSTCLIKYSKRVTGRINLLPKENIYSIVTPFYGKIVLLKKNEDKVEKGDIVAYIENPATYEDVNNLKRQIEKIDLNDIKNSLAKFDVKMSYSLGEIQEDYFNLIIAIYEYNQLINNNLNDLSIQNYHKLVETLEEESAIQNNLNKVLSDKYNLMKDNYKRDSILNELGTVSLSDIEKSNVSHLGFKENILNNKMSSASISYKKMEIKGQISSLNSKKESDINSKILGFKKQYLALLNKIKIWENSYLMKSSIDGIVFYVNSRLRSYDHVNRENELFYVLPSSKKIIGRAFVSSSGYGQLKIGQEAIVKINDYPSRDYGYIKGRISYKSPVKQDSTYYVDVALINGLNTNTNKNLEYYYNMSGTVEFITEKMSIFDRFFSILMSDGKFN